MASDDGQSLAMVLNLCDSFLLPVAGSLERARSSVEGNARAERQLETAAWQIDALAKAIRSYCRAQAPAWYALDGGDGISAAVRRANVLSYNIRPAVPAFRTPDAARSWEPLRQPVDYVALLRCLPRGRLCRVVSAESVRVVDLATGDDVSVDPGQRMRWIEANLQTTLRSGIKSYVVVFVAEQGSGGEKDGGDAKREDGPDQ